MSEAAEATIQTTSQGGSAPALSLSQPATPAAVAAPAQTGSGATAAPSWRDTLPPEIKGDPSLAKYNDVSALANAYINAAKMIGGDKIPIPGKHASEQDWENVFNKLGRPESPDKYELKLPDQIKEDKALVKSYSEAMHKAGVLPKQAQSVMDWWTTFSQARQAEVQTQIDQNISEGQGRLQQEWGQAAEQKFRQATAAVREYGGKEFSDLLTQTGLDKHPVMLKVMAKVGETLKEDVIHGPDSNQLGVTPAEAKQMISEIQGNKEHPYWLKEHPGHAGAMAEMQKLFGALHG